MAERDCAGRQRRIAAKSRPQSSLRVRQPGGTSFHFFPEDGACADAFGGVALTVAEVSGGTGPAVATAAPGATKSRYVGMDRWPPAAFHEWRIMRWRRRHLPSAHRRNLTRQTAASIHAIHEPFQGDDLRPTNVLSPAAKSPTKKGHNMQKRRRWSQPYVSSWAPMAVTSGPLTAVQYE